MHDAVTVVGNTVCLTVPFTFVVLTLPSRSNVVLNDLNVIVSVYNEFEFNELTLYSNLLAFEYDSDQWHEDIHAL